MDLPLEMTSRERCLRVATGKPVDRGIFWRDGFWPATLRRWQEEGMPDDYDFQFDIDGAKLDSLPVNMGYYPPFEVEVISEDGDSQLIRDELGVIGRVNEGQSMQFIEFPVHDRASWEQLKPRLDPTTPGRFPEDWPQHVQRLNQADHPFRFQECHLDGFFSFLRELCGERIYYWLYDDPDLVREILDFQVYRLTTFMRRITKDLQVDWQLIWEDMCYKKHPLIGPNTFREFLLEPYQRTIEVSRSLGVRIFDLDSDGDVTLLIPLWLEAGVTMIYPCEVAAGVDVVELKRTYGDRLVLRGGIDKRAVAAGFDAIDREMERIRPAYDMGGYIPCIDHSVPPDVSWQNYLYYLEKRKQLIGMA